MNKRLFINTAAIVAAITILSSCGDKKKTAPGGPGGPGGPVPVNLYTVHLQPAVYYDQYPGTVVALMQVDIRPEVEGYITGIFFKEGSHVHKGEKLYEIDRSKYMASYEQAQANVKVAEANQDQAQKDADRYIYLNEHDAVAKQILDHALTTLQNAKSQVIAAKQDLVKAQTDLNYSIIKAPFDGTIGISQVKLGNAVTTGQTVLNTISTDDPMAVDFVVNEKNIARFKRLQGQAVNPADSLFTILLPDNSLYNYVGKIYIIDRGVDPTTGTIRVRLEFPNQENILRSGMSCTVRVHNEDTEPQIIIPNKAITEQMGEYFVFVARDTTLPDSVKTKNNIQGSGPTKVALQKKVMLGQPIGANIIIKSGLADGDQVVVDGMQKLHDGSPINVSTKPAPQQSGTPATH